MANKYDEVASKLLILIKKIDPFEYENIYRSDEEAYENCLDYVKNHKLEVLGYLLKASEQECFKAQSKEIAEEIFEL